MLQSAFQYIAGNFYHLAFKTFHTAWHQYSVKLISYYPSRATIYTNGTFGGLSLKIIAKGRSFQNVPLKFQRAFSNSKQNRQITIKFHNNQLVKNLKSTLINH
jgi:hypothetical protein